MAFTYDPEIDIDEIPDELSDEAQFLEDHFIKEGWGEDMNTAKMAKGVKQREWGKSGGGMETTQMAGAAAQVVAGGIGMLDKTEEVDAPNYISDMLGMAGQGASMGATFGPWGAGIGAVVGAGAGLIKSTTDDKATNARIQERETQEKKFAQAASTTQTNPMFAKDGLKVSEDNKSVYKESMNTFLNSFRTGKPNVRFSQRDGLHADASMGVSNIAQFGNLGVDFSGRANVGAGFQGITNVGAGVNIGADYRINDRASLNVSGRANTSYGNNQFNSGYGLDAGANYNINDQWTLNPYMSYSNTNFQGQSNPSSSAGLRLRGIFAPGGKVKYTDKAKYEEAMKERQGAIDMYNLGLEDYLTDVEWDHSNMATAQIQRADMIHKYKQAGIAGEKYIQERGGRGGSDMTAYSFSVFPYPTQTPYYEDPPPPPSYIPFVTETGDTLTMSGDIQGTGANRALEEGWDSRISYINQLNQLAGK